MNKRHELARILLGKAEEDEIVIFAVPDAIGLPDSVFGFHCQQVAEKLLKAVLTARGSRYRRTHIIRELIGLISDTGDPLPDDIATLDEVSPFAVEFRYMDIPVSDEPPIDRDSLRTRLSALRSWAESQIERIEAD